MSSIKVISVINFMLLFDCVKFKFKRIKPVHGQCFARRLNPSSIVTRQRLKEREVNLRIKLV